MSYLKSVQYFASACAVFSVKMFSRIFYKTDAQWITPKEQIEWEKIRLAIVLNHTSLFEPLFVSAIPNYRIWRGVKRIVVPIADVTMNRPLAGFLFRLIAPNALPITRKRDETWDRLVEKANSDSIVLIFPEGRMKRRNGLDKNGKPMTVKGGVADLLSQMNDGKILIAYSEGLHHVQAPGELFPRFFKRIRIQFEQLDVADYKSQHPRNDSDSFRLSVINDLQSRMRSKCELSSKNVI